MVSSCTIWLAAPRDGWRIRNGSQWNPIVRVCKSKTLVTTESCFDERGKKAKSDCSSLNSYVNYASVLERGRGERYWILPTLDFSNSQKNTRGKLEYLTGKRYAPTC